MTESLKYFSIMNLCNLITILGNIMKEQQILSYMRGTSAVNLIVDFPSFLANKCKEESKKKKITSKNWFSMSFSSKQIHWLSAVSDWRAYWISRIQFGNYTGIGNNLYSKLHKQITSIRGIKIKILEIECQPIKQLN